MGRYSLHLAGWQSELFRFSGSGDYNPPGQESARQENSLRRLDGPAYLTTVSVSGALLCYLFPLGGLLQETWSGMQSGRGAGQQLNLDTTVSLGLTWLQNGCRIKQLNARLCV